MFASSASVKYIYMYRQMYKPFFYNVPLMWVLLLIGNLSCGGEHMNIIDVSLVEVSGLVTEFKARSLTEIDYLSLQTAEGQIYNFKVGNNLGKFTPSHIRQHMVHGELVEISYFQRDGENWLRSMQDFTLR
ncbi:MAG: hypothetical protein DK303_001026 [Chloroflexi bacterium]|nr:MAG: hypothetical protein DK303_001026 [Chloroflexota bacterium]